MMTYSQKGLLIDNAVTFTIVGHGKQALASVYPWAPHLLLQQTELSIALC